MRSIVHNGKWMKVTFTNEQGRIERERETERESEKESEKE